MLPGIPASVASIEDAWKSPDGSKVLVLVQDAHTNSSCQANESVLFDHLFRLEGGRPLVFTEAASGNANLSFLRGEAPAALRKRVAQEYLQKGLLHGIEHLDLTSERDFALEGVEDPELYFESLRVYAESAKKREGFEDHLAGMDAACRRIEPLVLNPFLSAYLEVYRRWQSGETGLSEYAGLLWAQAGSLKLSRLDYPALKKLTDLKARESKIDFVAANRELALAMRTLGEDDRRDLAGRLEASGLSMKEEQSGFFLRLEEKLKDLKPWPALAAYLRYLDESRGISPRDVLAESKRLEGQIFERLIVNEEEAKLLRAARTVSFYQKLFRLSLTPDEYAEFQATGFNGLASLSGFLNRKLMELDTAHDKAVFLKDGFDETAALCRRFYELTLERDEKFIEHMTAAWDADRARAYLIAGGYHAPSLKRLLKKKGISYVSVVPRILHETSVKRYEEILLSQPVSAAPAPAASARATMNAYLAPNEISASGDVRAGFYASLGAKLPDGAKLSERSSYGFDHAKRLLQAVQSPRSNASARRRALTALRRWQEREGQKGYLRKAGRIDAPLQIIVGHLDGNMFYPDRRQAVRQFFADLHEAELRTAVYVLVGVASKKSEERNPRTGKKVSSVCMEFLENLEWDLINTPKHAAFIDELRRLRESGDESLDPVILQLENRIKGREFPGSDGARLADEPSPEYRVLGKPFWQRWPVLREISSWIGAAADALGSIVWFLRGARRGELLRDVESAKREMKAVLDKHGYLRLQDSSGILMSAHGAALDLERASRVVGESSEEAVVDWFALQLALDRLVERVDLYQNSLSAAQEKNPPQEVELALDLKNGPIPSLKAILKKQLSMMDLKAGYGILAMSAARRIGDGQGESLVAYLRAAAGVSPDEIDFRNFNDWTDALQRVRRDLEGSRRGTPFTSEQIRRFSEWVNGRSQDFHGRLLVALNDGPYRARMVKAYEQEADPWYWTIESLENLLDFLDSRREAGARLAENSDAELEARVLTAAKAWLLRASTHVGAAQGAIAQAASFLDLEEMMLAGLGFTALSADISSLRKTMAGPMVASYFDEASRVNGGMEGLKDGIAAEIDALSDVLRFDRTAEFLQDAVMRVATLGIELGTLSLMMETLLEIFPDIPDFDSWPFVRLSLDSARSSLVEANHEFYRLQIGLVPWKFGMRIDFSRMNEKRGDAAKLSAGKLPRSRFAFLEDAENPDHPLAPVALELNRRGIHTQAVHFGGLYSEKYPDDVTFIRVDHDSLPQSLIEALAPLAKVESDPFGQYISFDRQAADSIEETRKVLGRWRRIMELIPAQGPSRIADEEPFVTADWKAFRDGAKLASAVPAPRGADRLIRAVGLDEESFRAGRVRIIDTRRFGNSDVRRIEVPARALPLAVPKGAEFLDNELAPVRQFELLYREGRLIAVFPVLDLNEVRAAIFGTPEAQEASRGDAYIVSRARYFDFSQYHFDIPRYDEAWSEAAARAAWARFSDQWKADQAAIEAFREEADPANPHKKGISRHSYGISGYNHSVKDYIYLEIGPNGSLERLISFGPDGYRPDFGKRPGVHQLIFRVFPGVYNPAGIAAVQTKARFFPMIFGPQLDVRKGDLTWDVGSGSGNIAYILWLRSQTKGIATAYSDVEAANVADTADAAGMPLTVAMHDNIVGPDGEPHFTGVKRLVWDMPYLSYRQPEPELGRIRLHQYWDGGPGARQTLETFGRGLRAVLGEGGRFLIWQEPFYEFGGRGRVDVVRGVLERGGAVVEGTVPVSAIDIAGWIYYGSLGQADGARLAVLGLSAEERRRRILEILEKGPHTVRDIATELSGGGEPDARLLGVVKNDTQIPSIGAHKNLVKARKRTTAPRDARQMLSDYRRITGLLSRSDPLFVDEIMERLKFERSKIDAVFQKYPRLRTHPKVLLKTQWSKFSSRPERTEALEEGVSLRGRPFVLQAGWYAAPELLIDKRDASEGRIRFYRRTDAKGAFLEIFYDDKRDSVSYSFKDSGGVPVAKHSRRLDRKGAREVLNLFDGSVPSNLFFDTLYSLRGPGAGRAEDVLRLLKGLAGRNAELSGRLKNQEIEVGGVTFIASRVFASGKHPVRVYRDRLSGKGVGAKYAALADELDPSNFLVFEVMKRGEVRVLGESASVVEASPEEMVPLHSFEVGRRFYERITRRSVDVLAGPAEIGRSRPTSFLKGIGLGVSTYSAAGRLQWLTVMGATQLDEDTPTSDLPGILVNAVELRRKYQGRIPSAAGIGRSRGKFILQPVLDGWEAPEWTAQMRADQLFYYQKVGRSKIREGFYDVYRRIDPADRITSVKIADDRNSFTVEGVEIDRKPVEFAAGHVQLSLLLYLLSASEPAAIAPLPADVRRRIRIDSRLKAIAIQTMAQAAEMQTASLPALHYDRNRRTWTFSEYSTLYWQNPRHSGQNYEITRRRLGPVRDGFVAEIQSVPETRPAEGARSAESERGPAAAADAAKLAEPLLPDGMTPQEILLLPYMGSFRNERESPALTLTSDLVVPPVRPMTPGRRSMVLTWLAQRLEDHARTLSQADLGESGVYSRTTVRLAPHNAVLRDGTVITEISLIKLNDQSRRVEIRSADGAVRLYRADGQEFFSILGAMAYFLDGREVEQDSSMARMPVNNRDFWKGWQGKMVSHLYPNQIHPIAADALQAVLRRRAQDGAAGVPALLDILGGDGNFLDEAARGAAPGSARYFLLEGDAGNVEAARARFVRRGESPDQAKVCDFTGPVDIVREIGARPDVVTCVGGIAQQVLSYEDAQRTARSVYDALPPGGYFIVTGRSGSHLNAGDFRRLGFEVLNQSIPTIALAVTTSAPGYLYVLRKPAAAKLAVADPRAAAWIAEWKELKRSSQTLPLEDAENALIGKLYEWRKVWTDENAQPALAELFFYLLLDENFAVRRTVIEFMLGFRGRSFPVVFIEPEVMFEHIRRPQQSAERYGEPDFNPMTSTGYDPGRGIRNKRLSLLAYFAYAATGDLYRGMGLSEAQRKQVMNAVAAELEAGVSEFAKDAPVNSRSYLARLFRDRDAVLDGAAPLSLFDLLVLERARFYLKQNVFRQGGDRYEWLWKLIGDGLLNVSADTRGVIAGLTGPDLRGYLSENADAAKLAVADPRVKAWIAEWNALKAQPIDLNRWDKSSPYYVLLSGWRELWKDPANRPALTDLFLFLLLDENFEVRRSIVEYMVGYRQMRPIVDIDADLLLEHLRNPLLSIDVYGTPAHDPRMAASYQLDRGVRNKRLAILAYFAYASSGLSAIGLSDQELDSLRGTIRRELIQGMRAVDADPGRAARDFRQRLLDRGDRVLMSAEPMSFFEVLICENARGYLKKSIQRTDDPYQWLLEYLHEGILALSVPALNFSGRVTNDWEFQQAYNSAHPVRIKRFDGAKLAEWAEMPQLPSAEELREWYKQFDSRDVLRRDGRDEVRLSMISHDPEIRARVVRMISSLGPNLRILSVGAGRGHLEKDLAAAGHSVRSIDLSPDNARHARKKHGITVEIVDAHDLSPLGEEKYDVIVYSESIGHLEIARAFKAAEPRLKEGGHVVITHYLPQVWGAREATLRVSKYFRYLYTEVRDALRSAGLEIERQDEMHSSRLQFAKIQVYVAGRAPLAGVSGVENSEDGAKLASDTAKLVVSSVDGAFDHFVVNNGLVVKELPAVAAADGASLRVRIAGDETKVRLRQVGSALYYDRRLTNYVDIEGSGFTAVPVNDVLIGATSEDAKLLGGLAFVSDIDIHPDHTPIHSTHAAIAGLERVSELIPGRRFIDLGSHTGILAAFAADRASELILVDSNAVFLKSLIDANLGRTDYSLYKDMGEVPAAAVEDSVLVSNLNDDFGIETLKKKIFEKGYRPAAMVIAGGRTSDVGALKAAIASHPAYDGWSFETVSADGYAALVALSSDAARSAEKAGKAKSAARLAQRGAELPEGPLQHFDAALADWMLGQFGKYDGRAAGPRARHLSLSPDGKRILSDLLAAEDGTGPESAARRVPEEEIKDAEVVTIERGGREWPLGIVFYYRDRFSYFDLADLYADPSRKIDEIRWQFQRNKSHPAVSPEVLDHLKGRPGSFDSAFSLILTSNVSALAVSRNRQGTQDMEVLPRQIYNVYKLGSKSVDELRIPPDPRPVFFDPADKFSRDWQALLVSLKSSRPELFKEPALIMGPGPGIDVFYADRPVAMVDKFAGSAFLSGLNVRFSQAIGQLPADLDVRILKGDRVPEDVDFGLGLMNLSGISLEKEPAKSDGPIVAGYRIYAAEFQTLFDSIQRALVAKPGRAFVIRLAFRGDRDVYDFIDSRPALRFEALGDDFYWVSATKPNTGARLAVLPAEEQRLIDALWSKVSSAGAATEEAVALKKAGYDVFIGNKSELLRLMSGRFYGGEHWIRDIHGEARERLSDAVTNAVDNLRQHRGDAARGFEKGVLLFKVRPTPAGAELDFICLDNGPGFVNRDTGERVSIDAATRQGVAGKSLGGKGTGFFGIGVTILVRKAYEVTYREFHFNRASGKVEGFRWSKTTDGGEEKYERDVPIDPAGVDHGTQIVWRYPLEKMPSSVSAEGEVFEGRAPVAEDFSEPPLSYAQEDPGILEARLGRYSSALEHAGIPRDRARVLAEKLVGAILDQFAWPVASLDVNRFAEKAVGRMVSDDVLRLELLGPESSAIERAEAVAEETVYGPGARLASPARSERAAAWIEEWRALKASSRAYNTWSAGNPLYRKVGEWHRLAADDPGNRADLQELFLYLLLDQNFMVRRAVVEILLGGGADPAFPIDQDLLLEHLRDPQISIARYGEPDFDPAASDRYEAGRGIRNKRLAILTYFVFASKTDSDVVPKANRPNVSAVVAREIAAGFERFERDREGSVAAARARLLRDGDEVLARAEPLSLFDALVLEAARSYAKRVHRAEDAYSWLFQETESFFERNEPARTAFEAVTAAGFAESYRAAHLKSPLSAVPVTSDAGEQAPQQRQISFLLKVYRSAGHGGALVLGSDRFQLVEYSDGVGIYLNNVPIRAFKNTQIRQLTLPGDVPGAQVTMSMADFKIVLDAAFQAFRDIAIDGSMDQRPAALELDLDRFDPGQGFREAILPILIEEVKHAVRRPYAQNAAILVKSADRELAERVAAEINRTGDAKTVRRIAFSDEKDVPAEYLERRSLLTTPSAASLDPNARRVFLRAPRKGDIPNFRVGIRAAMLLARMRTVNAETLASTHLSDLLRAAMSGIDLELFARVAAGLSLDPGEAERAALPPITTLPIEAWIRGAKLAARLIEQSA